MSKFEIALITMCGSIWSNFDSLSWVASFHFPLSKDNSEGMDQIGPVGRRLIRALNEIDGIEEVFLTLYAVQIDKSSVYEWSELESDIFFAIETAVGSKVTVKKS